MARPKQQQQQQQQQGAEGGGINYLERPILAINNELQLVDTQRARLMDARSVLTSGKTGGAGGISKQRGDAGGNGGTGGEGQMSNPEWITQLLREYPKGLTAKRLREVTLERIQEFTARTGRKPHASFPHDSLQKMRDKKLVSRRGEKYALTPAGIRMDKAGEPNVGRTKKKAGRSMAMTA